MSKRLSMKEAAAILDCHIKTLERYTKENKDNFNENTGYMKNKINGRATFDEMFFRTYAANVTGNDDLRIAQYDDLKADLNAVDAEFMALAKTTPTATIERQSDQPGIGGLELAAAISRAFILPGKIFLTLHEAKELTGFPLTELRKISSLIFGRRLIKRTDLENISVSAAALRTKSKPEKI